MVAQIYWIKGEYEDEYKCENKEIRWWWWFEWSEMKEKKNKLNGNWVKMERQKSS